MGKSTVCREAAARARAGGHACGGIVTLSRPDGSRDVLDVGSGDVRRLTLAPGASGGVVQGRFRFDPRVVAWGNGLLAAAVPCDLLVVDELGPLEIERGAGWVRAFDVLREGDFALAVVVVRPELVARAQAELSCGGPTVLTVTTDNRDRLPGLLLRMLEAELHPQPSRHASTGRE